MNLGKNANIQVELTESELEHFNGLDDAEKQKFLLNKLKQMFSKS